MKNLLIILTVILSFNIYAEKIKFWYYAEPEVDKAFHEIFQKYELASGNEIDSLNVPFFSMFSKYEVSAANGYGPDIVMAPVDKVGVYEQQNIIKSIDSYVSEKDRSEFLDEMIDSCVYNEKLYGLPINFVTLALIYNKDLIEDCPKNMEELIRIGAEFTNPQENTYGLLYNKTLYYYHIVWLGAFGTSIVNEKGYTNFDTDEHMRSISFVKSMQEGDQQVLPEIVDGSTILPFFTEGMVPMIIEGSWILKDLMSSGMNFEIANIPYIESEKKWPTPPVTSHLLMLSAFTEKDNVAVDFMKYFSSEESQITLAKAGYFPTRKAVYDSRVFKRNKIYPYVKAFMEQAKKGIFIPNGPEISDAMWINGTFLLSKVLDEGGDLIVNSKLYQEKAFEVFMDMKKN